MVNLVQLSFQFQFLVFPLRHCDKNREISHICKCFYILNINSERRAKDTRIIQYISLLEYKEAIWCWTPVVQLVTNQTKYLLILYDAVHVEFTTYVDHSSTICTLYILQYCTLVWLALRMTFKMMAKKPCHIACAVDVEIRNGL